MVTLWRTEPGVRFTGDLCWDFTSPLYGRCTTVMHFVAIGTEQAQSRQQHLNGSTPVGLQRIQKINQILLFLCAQPNAEPRVIKIHQFLQRSCVPVVEVRTARR